MSEAACLDKVQACYNRFWYVPDIFLVGLLFVYARMGPLASYLGGLRNDEAYGFTLAIYWVLLLPAALICLAVIVLRLGITWPKHKHGPKRFRMGPLFAVVGLGICLALFFLSIGPPGYQTFTGGFRKYVQANADIPAIRAWLSTLDPNICTGQQVWIGESNRKQETDWPEPVTSLHLHYVLLRLDRDKYPVVRLGWAALDAFWGVEIGPEDMEIPETLPRQKVQVGGSTMYEHGEYRLPVSPGVYVWHETG